MSIKLQGKAITRPVVKTAHNEFADILLDNQGRQLTRVQVRDLITTAFASLTGGTKTSLVTGVSGRYLDLYQISWANDSDAATTITVTDESTTVLSIRAAANVSDTMFFPMPLKQSATGVDWYADLPDISGTTITINAAFTQEI